VVISDLPDPSITPSTKLYSQEFYGLAARVLSDGGRFVVHAGTPESRPRTFWTVDATLRAAGFATRPYCAATGRLPGVRTGRADASTTGSAATRDWGFLLAATGRAPRLGLDPRAPELRSPAPSVLAAGVLAAGARGAERTRLPGLPPSTLVHPRYTD
jgi:spermidine synthase